MRKILTAATLSVLLTTMSCGGQEAGEWQLPPGSVESAGKGDELRPLRFGPSCESVLYEWQVAYYRDLGASPCGLGGNFANGLEVTWMP